MEYLDIPQWHMSWTNDPKLAPMETLRRKDMLSAANKKLFDGAVEESNYIPAGGFNQWKDQFTSGCEDQVLGLLFIRLPNISTLHLSAAYWSYNSLTCTLDRISRDPRPTALTMLTQLTLSTENRQTSFELVKMFASLPSMRQIYAKDVIAGSGDTYPCAPHSKVASLNLISCQAEPDPMFELPSTFDYLVAFEYTSAKPDGHCLSGKNLNNTCWIHNALLHQAKHSLKKLTLRGVNT